MQGCLMSHTERMHPKLVSCLCSALEAVVICMRARPKTKVGIVGTTGCGKPGTKLSRFFRIP